MIERIELRHFKCFEHLVLPLGPMTLLSGSNAAGKSTALQALVLLHQTMQQHEWSTRLHLNGRSLQLGTVLDVVDKVHGRRSFGIALGDGEVELSWSFAGERGDMSMLVEAVSVDRQEWREPTVLRYLLPPEASSARGEVVAVRLRDMSYITAERVGPREVYPLEDKQSARVVGPRGEHTVSVLYHGTDEDVLAELRLPEAAPTRLKQIEARMRLFFPGCGLVVQRIPQTNALSLGLRSSDDTDFHRPVHIGFGLTQVLPIVVAALSAREGDLLLVENPEVHLHPAAQAMMGGFLAELAAARVQVIVETHSDHVLNGLRRAVKAEVLSPQDCALHFFRPRSKAQHEQVVSPVLDERGNIDFWPEGFFDQFDKDLNHFAGWDG